MPSQDNPKESLINIRTNSSTKEYIDRAAQSIGKDPRNFMLEAAYEKAQEILLDRTEFALDDKQWAEFNRVLDCPPKPNEKLIKLLTSPAPWKD